MHGRAACYRPALQRRVPLRMLMLCMRLRAGCRSTPRLPCSAALAAEQGRPARLQPRGCHALAGHARTLCLDR